MDLQNLFDAISKAARDTRKDYHVTLGQLIAELKSLPQAHPVKFDDGKFPDEVGSYRGYYSDMYLAPSNKPTTVGELLATCEQALNKEFQGYKGGEYVMDDGTPLWCATYGCCGSAIVGVELEEDMVILSTKLLD